MRDQRVECGLRRVIRHPGIWSRSWSGLALRGVRECSFIVADSGAMGAAYSRRIAVEAAMLTGVFGSENAKYPQRAKRLVRSIW
jgi:hypothetical protein